MSRKNSGRQDEAIHYRSSFGDADLASKVDLEPYIGRWVAITGDRVAGVGETALSAEHMGRRNRVRERLAVYFVEPLEGTPFPFSEIFEQIRPILIGMDIPIYLVGGAVRDGLLGHASHDLDFVVPSNGIQTAFKVANRLGYPAYVLDQERDAGRVVLDEPGVTLDFTSYRGSDLETDLRARDFTINAMALPIAAQSFRSLIDPLQAAKDVIEQRIRLCYPMAISDDPVRGLRAIRMVIETGFQPTESTISAVITAAPLLANVSEERTRDELLKLLATDMPATALDYLVLWQIFPTLFPRLNLMADDDEGDATTTPTMVRTKKLLEKLVSLQHQIIDYRSERSTNPLDADSRLSQTCAQLLPYQAALVSHFNRQFAGGLDGWLLLRLTAVIKELCHTDPGRVDRCQSGGKPGENIDLVFVAGNMLKRYRFSNEVSYHIKQTIRVYEKAASLLETSSVDRRSAYRFFKAAPDAGLDICMLAIAGELAFSDESKEAAGWTGLLLAVTRLMDYFFNHYHTTIQPTPLVDGNDLIRHLSLTPGPEIGRLLRLIEEAQAVGEVHKRSQALDLARKHVSSE